MPFTTFADGQVLSAATMTAIHADPVVADVATSQTTTSGTFADLATTGPSVTVTMVVGQVALVIVSCVTTMASTTSGRMGWAVSGAETQAATGSEATYSSNTVATGVSRPCLFTATVAGSHTFTAKYTSSSGSTATFQDRRIIVKVW